MITIRKRTLYIWLAVTVFLFLLSCPTLSFIPKFLSAIPDETPLPAYPDSVAVKAEKIERSFLCGYSTINDEYQAYSTDDNPARITNYYRDQAIKLSKIGFREYTDTCTVNNNKNKLVTDFEDWQGRIRTFKELLILDSNDRDDALYIQEYFGKAVTKRYLILLRNQRVTYE